MDEITRRGFLAAAGSLPIAGIAATETSILRTGGHVAPRITLAITDYLRFTPIATGRVGSRDFELRSVRGTRREMLDRTLSDPEVDAGEGSMLGHLLRVDRADRSMVAVPVFLLRNFVARDLYTLRGSELGPTHLTGRRIGIYNWAASGAVWYRQFVRYMGNDPAAMEWVVGGTDEPRTITHRAPLPPNVSDAPAGLSLTDLLERGELDACFAPLPPAAYDATKGRLVRLIPDYRSLEQQYFRDTGCYPPQHVLLVKRAAWERMPSLGSSLLEIFEQCEAVFTAGQRQYPYNTPWMIQEVEETERLMGAEYHAHGLRRNRAQVDTFCQAAYEDGLTARRITVDEYFAEFLAAS